MVAEYQSGDPSSVIGERYGVAGNSVLRLLHGRGVVVRIGKLNEAAIRQMINLYESEETQQAVGARFGVTRGAVRTVLLKQGVRLRRGGPSPSGGSS